MTKNEKFLYIFVIILEKSGRKKDLLHFELLFTNAWDLQVASVKFDIKLSSTTYKNTKITLKPLI